MANQQIKWDGGQSDGPDNKAEIALEAESKRKFTKLEEPEKNTQPTLFLHFGF